ncbi:MAG: hypothetical protein ACI9FJ_002473, partial [Alteromonadaceae bacterium]
PVLNFYELGFVGNEVDLWYFIGCPFEPEMTFIFNLNTVYQSLLFPDFLTSAPKNIT